MRIRAAGRRRSLDPRSFPALLDALLDELRVRWYSKPLQKQARNVLRRFLSHLSERRIRDIRAVSEADVTAYARLLAQTKTAKGTIYSLSTQRSYLMLVQRLFRFLEEQGVILRNPALDLPLPHWKKLPRALLNQAQSRRLVSAPDAFTVRGKRDRAILELLYGTAIRVGECERLDVRDLDLAREQLFIRDGKGRKDRVVPVMGRAAAAVDAYLLESRPELQRDPKEPALFLTSWGQRLRVARIQDLVRSHAKAAGLDLRVTPHTLRHGCATHLLQNGADVRHVQKLLGHTSVQTTAIYTKVTTTDLARVVARAHPRERTWSTRRKKARR